MQLCVPWGWECMCTGEAGGGGFCACVCVFWMRTVSAHILLQTFVVYFMQLQNGMCTYIIMLSYI